MNVFSREVRIRFSHSDPAGIVYYPNYFDMFNSVIEDWFADALGVDYPTQIAEYRRGFPTVHAACDFIAPSRMGETLTLTLLIEGIGRSSLKLAIHGHVAAVERLRASLVLVIISLDTGKSIPIPADLRRSFEAYRDASSGWTLAGRP
jgi:4-hydroxybenzoyl-CoA thioesterase